MTLLQHVLDLICMIVGGVCIGTSHMFAGWKGLSLVIIGMILIRICLYIFK